MFLSHLLRILANKILFLTFEELRTRELQEAGLIESEDAGPTPLERQQDAVESSELDRDDMLLVGRYKPRVQRELFETEKKAREEFIAEIGNDSRIESFTEALLKAAVREQRATPGAVIDIVLRDGVYEVRKTFPGEETFVFNKGKKQERLPIKQFLARAIQYAQRAKPERRNVRLVKPDGSSVEISLFDLMQAGRSLLRTRENTEFVGGAGTLNTNRAALSEILTELAIYKEDVEFNAELGNLLGDEVGGVLRYDITDTNGVSLLNRNNYDYTVVPKSEAKEGQKRINKYRYNRFKGENSVVYTQKSSDISGLGTKKEKVGKQKTKNVTINFLLGRGVRGSEATSTGDFDPDQDKIVEETTRFTDPETGARVTQKERLDPDEDVEKDIAQRAADPDMQTSEIGLDEPSPEERVRANEPLRGAGQISPSTGSPAPTTWKDSEITKAVVDGLLALINLDQRPQIISMAELSNSTDQQVRNLYIREPAVASSIIALRNKLNDSKTMYGLYDRSTNVIVIKETGNAVFDSLLIAHEVGHALFRQEQTRAMRNPALRKRLEASYKRSKFYKNYKQLGGSYELGFEEWYADQVAKWATKKYIDRKAKNRVELHFKNLVKQIKDLFKSFTSESFKRRFAGITTKNFVSPTFNQYMEHLTVRNAKYARRLEIKRRMGEAPAVYTGTTFDVSGVQLEPVSVGSMQPRLRGRATERTVRTDEARRLLDPSQLPDTQSVANPQNATEDAQAEAPSPTMEQIQSEATEQPAAQPAQPAQPAPAATPQRQRATRAAQQRSKKRRDPAAEQEKAVKNVTEIAQSHAADANTLTVQQTLFDDLNENTSKIPGYNSIKRAYESNLVKDLVGAIRSVLLPADNILRKVAGDEIADQFYVRSQDLAARGKLGFLRAVNTTVGRWKNRFEKEIGSLEDPEVQDGFEEAFSGKPTAELKGKARAIREYLEAFYDEYIDKSNTPIGKRPDYFPISLNLFEITQRSEEFKQVLMRADPTLKEEDIDNIIKYFVELTQSSATQPAIDSTAPSAAVEQMIRLTKNIKDRSVLRDFVNPPNLAFIDYMRHVIKRVEFNRATGGPDALNNRLAKLDPENRVAAEEIIRTYLGYQKAPLSPWMRKLNSWGQFLQFITILPFATIASLPDLAGPIINHKDFSGLWAGLKQVGSMVKNRQEAQQLARDIGVVTSETVANAWVTQAEQDFMDPTVRKFSDGYFKLIGLDWFTKFSREFASGMGVQFLLKHARNEDGNPNSARYLQELGVTPEEILAWNENKSFDTPEGEKVRDALARFVESSIMRPNAAERPVWASDPRWALVWQLKGYFYSYYKTIVGGVLREGKMRVGETKGAAQLTAVSAVLLLTAVATMPLAMLGLELREYAKNGLAWILPGVEADQKYFRSDKMDWDDYWFEIIEKSGFLGPMSMLRASHQNAEWGDSAIFSLLGPTAETIEEAFKNGWRVDRTLGNRLLPIYSQL